MLMDSLKRLNYVRITEIWAKKLHSIALPSRIHTDPTMAHGKHGTLLSQQTPDL